MGLADVADRRTCLTDPATLCIRWPTVKGAVGYAPGRAAEERHLRTRIIIVVVLSAACLAALSVHAGAIVPPKNCGKLEAKGKRYNVKADQMRCRTARKHARRYLTGAGKPRGYTCRNYGRDTKIKFRCSKGIKVVFAIRR
jgi:hypothetical protein